MKVFIGWSGNVSKHVAKSLYEWLEHVDHALKPWMSEMDIDAGDAWRSSLDEALKGEDTSAGIFCITPDTESAPWMCYEAGHLAALDRRVIPYAVGYRRVGDVPEPWASRQVKMATEDGTREIVVMLCKLHSGKLEVISKAFEQFWPELDKSLQNTPKKKTVKVRPDPEKLDEALKRLRNIEAILVAKPVPATPKKRVLPGVRRRSASNRVSPLPWSLLSPDMERQLESVRHVMDSPELERMKEALNSPEMERTKEAVRKWQAQLAPTMAQLEKLKLRMPELFGGPTDITDESRSEDEQDEGEDEEEPNEKE